MAFRVAYDSGDLGNTGHSFDLTHDYEGLVIELCQVLAEADGARFTLSGFGREPWPMSVDYDMSVFLEQLPDLLENLESGDLFRLDMYSQGTEAKLEFSPDGDELTITCSSRTAWVPDPATERIGHGPLLQMLSRPTSRSEREQSTRPSLPSSPSSSGSPGQTPERSESTDPSTRAPDALPLPIRRDATHLAGRQVARTDGTAATGTGRIHPAINRKPGPVHT